MKVSVKITAAQAAIVRQVVSGLAWDGFDCGPLVDDPMRGDAAVVLGWSTTNDNRVWLSDADTVLNFSTTRHALRDDGNGVGAVFWALGGDDWAKDAQVIILDSHSDAPWWTAGVKPSKDGQARLDQDQADRARAVGDDLFNHAFVLCGDDVVRDGNDVLVTHDGDVHRFSTRADFDAWDQA